MLRSEAVAPCAVAGEGGETDRGTGGQSKLSGLLCSSDCQAWGRAGRTPARLAGKRQAKPAASHPCACQLEMRLVLLVIPRIHRLLRCAHPPAQQGAAQHSTAQHSGQCKKGPVYPFLHGGTLSVSSRWQQQRPRKQ